ncbi:stress-induced-phosphoprotein 1 [Venturia nashicola]|uniref:Stress-induced-phosphoprotein 1 n=1 Tax=Venturia nashicola TaxID=86259 RepID=A0A4Z1NXX3_9PEZI|nr:stress-induced-phosphoprotein 1 [Venturia nashicola]
MADALKQEGNKLFAEKKFAESIEKFTEAIKLEPKNHVLYSNRAGSYASLKQHHLALEDANKVVEIKPDWPKGWTRKAAALHGEGDLLGAKDAYEKALELDGNNAAAKAGLQSVERAMQSEGGGGGMGGADGGLGGLFSDPSLFQKLASNPKTAPLLADKEFMAKLQQVQKNPNDIGMAMQDPRFLSVMGVMLGIDMSMSDKMPGGATELGSDRREVEEDVKMPDAPSNEPEYVPEPEDEEAKAKKEAKLKADEEKALGTASYKKRNFDEAIEHYTKAWDLHKDIVYLNNLGAAYFEKGDYEKSVETCQKAVEEGREMLADFKLIAKAFGRIGSAYEKQGDLTKAIDNYQRSLTEHRTPEILNKLRAAEKAKIKAEKESYINPEEAEKARELGNQKFKEAEWAAAVEAYSEMIKRGPDDPRGYSNRAACFIKLLAFPSAVTDCDEAIKRDPKFIRAYLRKAQALFAMREYNRCLDVCTEAAEHDEGRKNAREIEQQQQKALQAQYSAREGETEEQTMERIQKDPEIMQILQDPVMQSILQQAKQDPAALQEHMRNPGIQIKIQKLVAAGVIRMGR